jgi:hypothetical protein
MNLNNKKGDIWATGQENRRLLFETKNFIFMHTWAL